MKFNHQSLPKISIVVPTKNRCFLLKEAIASVSQQTYSNWELIIVDDDSTDETDEQISAMSAKDSRIRFLQRSIAQSGAPSCRNEGIAASTGDYVIFLDSDDCLAPFCLQQRVEIMNTHPELDFAVFPCQLFRCKPGDVDVLWNADTSENDIDRFLNLDVPWQTSSPIWRKKAIVQVGLWDEELLSFQDWEFHLRALIKGLNYKKFSNPDCFWRMPDKDSIGLKSVTTEHLCSHERLLSHIQDMLEKSQCLNENRKCLLAGLYFWLARQWASYENRNKEIMVWKICQEKQLIGVLTYWEGLLYFNVYKFQFTHQLIYKYLTLRWSRKLLFKFSNTFRQTPLSIAV